MSGTVLQQWLSYFVIPPASCATSLLTWRAVVRRGWSRPLPVLTLYVIFSCVAYLILLVAFYLQLYPGPFQQTVCRLYASGYQLTGVVLPLLLIAAIVELMNHMFGQDAEGHRRYTLVITGGTLALATLSACLIAIQGAGPAHGMLEKTFTLISQTSSLVIIGLVSWLFVMKRRRSLALGSSLTLIAIIVGVYFLIDFVSSFIMFRANSAAKQGVLVHQALWLAYSVMFYWAMTREPRTPQAALLPS